MITDNTSLLLFQTETICKPSIVAAAKNSFSSVYVIATTFFGKWFLFHMVTERHYF